MIYSLSRPFSRGWNGLQGVKMCSPASAVTLSHLSVTSEMKYGEIQATDLKGSVRLLKFPVACVRQVSGARSVEVVTHRDVTDFQKHQIYCVINSFFLYLIHVLSPCSL